MKEEYLCFTLGLNHLGITLKNMNDSLVWHWNPIDELHIENLSYKALSSLLECGDKKWWFNVNLKSISPLKIRLFG